MTTDPTPVRIPIGRNVTYAVRGMPEVANEYGPGYLVPTEISLTYRATEDSQLGRFHAYVKGHWRRDGEEVSAGEKLPGQHYYGDPSTWPAWLAEEARLHDPDAVLPPPADRAAVLRDLIAEAEEWDGHITVQELRRLAAEAPEPTSATCPHCKRWYVTSEPGAHEASCPLKPAAEAPEPATQAEARQALIAELLPVWEAMYEPGNVSDYLIGYTNHQDAATGAAEAWMRSQAEVTGRLEWVPQNPLDGYDMEFELVERHDDGVDTGPGITVRRRVDTAAVPAVGQTEAAEAAEA